MIKFERFILLLLNEYFTRLKLKKKELIQKANTELHHIKA